MYEHRLRADAIGASVQGELEAVIRRRASPALSRFSSGILIATRYSSFSVQVLTLTLDPSIRSAQRRDTHLC